PYAHAKVVSIDTSAAEKMTGVKAIKVIQGPGSEIQWAGDEVVALAAVDEATAAAAVQAGKGGYEKVPHLVGGTDPVGAGPRGKSTAQESEGDPDKAFRESAAVVEGDYGVPVITHCCLEAHGQISEWTDKEHLLVHPSTQNVSGIATQMGTPLGMPPGNIKVHMDHVGGGFGSKFGPDRWGIVTAQLSQLAGGKPVKIMLERSSELEVAGCRPSTYAHVKVGARQDGTIVAWESKRWGTGGVQPRGPPPLPYIFNIPDYPNQDTSIENNNEP